MTVTIDVENTLKGRVPSTLQVMVNAGTAWTDANGMFQQAGPLTLNDEAQAVFAEGEKVFVYLTPLVSGPFAGWYQVYEWFQGKLTISRDPATGQEVIGAPPPSPAMSFYDVGKDGSLEKAAAPSQAKMPLSGYVEKVKSILSANDYKVIPQHYSPTEKAGKTLKVPAPGEAWKAAGEQGQNLGMKEQTMGVQNFPALLEKEDPNQRRVR